MLLTRRSQAGMALIIVSRQLGADRELCMARCSTTPE